MEDADGDVDVASSPKPVESIEVENEVKEEDAADDASDAENDAQDTSGGQRPVSNQLYKAFKNITDILLNLKYTTKNNE